MVAQDQYIYYKGDIMRKILVHNIFGKNIKLQFAACLILGLFILPGFARPFEGEEHTILSKTLVDLLRTEISGETAFGHVANLSGWAKNRPAEEYTGQFYETKYILQKAKEYGLDKTDLEIFPWEYPCWDPISADLWMVEPEERKITGLDQVHLCLLEGSKSSDVTAEVIDVGEGTSPSDYEGKDVAGKIVLCSGSEAIVNTLAVHERGALGILCYRSYYPDEYPDMVSWGGVNSLMTGSGEKTTFGFMLSPRQGHQMKLKLGQGMKVKVHASIEVQTHPGKLDVIQTLIRGSEFPNEEILLMAHLFEYYYKQGANDNKSGSAAILEIGRVLQKLIRDGRIPRPKRSIRILWEPEGWGTFAWMKKYPEAIKKVKAVIDMDMVGEGHSLCGTRLHILETPDSLPHFLNAVIKDLAEYVRLNSGWSERVGEKSFDEIMASPTGSRDAFYYDVIHFNPRFFNENWIGIPSILFNCGPDPFYHSSEDRPDKCDPTQLKRVAFLGAAAALYLADLDRGNLTSLIPLVMAEQEEILGADHKKAYQILSRSDAGSLHRKYQDATNIIRHGLDRHRRVLLSIGSWLHLETDKQDRLAALVPDETAYVSESLRRYYLALCRELNLQPETPALTALEKELSRHIPERLVGFDMLVDFLFLEHALDDPDIKSKIKLKRVDPMVTWETLNFCNGKRSVLDIRNAVAAEFAPSEISIEEVAEYFRILEKAGVVRISAKR